MNLPRLLFIISLVFFLIRNITLSLAMPIWSHGDEMAHVDYILKVGRGNIPTASEQIEPELFKFHREYGVLPSHTSDRESHTSRANIKDIRGLGYGGYSYQSKHPPLAYFIFALFQKLFQFLGLSLLIQIKLLRLISLAVVLLGMLAIFFELAKQTRFGAPYFLTLISLPLLAQDMFFCVNNDTFSFFFGCLVVVGMLRLSRDPYSNRNWLWISLAVALSLWVKLTNVLLLGLFVLFLILFLFNRREKKLLLPSVFYILLPVLLALPWYVYRQISHGAWWTSHVPAGVPHPTGYHVAALNLDSLWLFLRAFTRTLFRGELLWRGEYFDLFSEGMNDIFLTVLPLLLAVAGLAAVFITNKDPKRDDISVRHFILLGPAAGLALLFGYFYVGLIPFYQARLAMASFYFLLFPCCLGALKIFRAEKLAYALVFSALFLYNFFYTAKLLSSL